MFASHLFYPCLSIISLFAITFTLFLHMHMLCVLRRCFRPRVASFYYCCYYSAVIFDFPPLIQAACFLFAFSQPDTIQQLLKRIEILETHQKGDIEAHIARLSTYCQRHLSNFDKYTALSMAESLASDAKQVNHSKASFLAVASARKHCDLICRSPARFSWLTSWLCLPTNTRRFSTASRRSTSPFVQIPLVVPPTHPRTPRVLLVEDSWDLNVLFVSIVVLQATRLIDVIAGTSQHVLPIASLHIPRAAVALISNSHYCTSEV